MTVVSLDPTLRHRSLLRRETHLRLTAAAFSLVMTGMLLTALKLDTVVNPQVSQQPGIAYLRLPIDERPASPAAAPPTLALKQVNTTMSQSAKPRGNSALQFIPHRAEKAIDAASGTATTAAPQSAVRVESSVSEAPARPLDLGTAVVRRAIRESRGEVQRLADASDAYAGDAEAGHAERLARDVARAGKQHCLREGGSLLSAFVLLYELASDKCTPK